MNYPVFETLRGSFDRREHGHPKSTLWERKVLILRDPVSISTSHDQSQMYYEQHTESYA